MRPFYKKDPMTIFELPQQGVPPEIPLRIEPSCIIRSSTFHYPSTLVIF
jgi:hypothetical protein